MSTSDTPTSISGAVAEQHSTVQQDVRGLLAQRPVQLAALTALLVASGVIALTLKFCVLDLDIWWHLKVGDWMVAHHAVPHTGILSRTAAGRPWIAYSWGYEVLMSLFYRWLGILGVGWYGVLLTVGVTYAIYWMLRRIAGSFWIAWLLTAITCYAFLLLMMPRPVYFSIILFCVALAWLVEADRSGDFRRLYWLPALFFVWANLHIQFIYGLFLVGLLFGVALLQWVAEVIGFEPEWLRPATLSPFRVGVIFAACVVATCIGPNWFHPYLAIASYSKAKVTYGMIIELQALNFHAVAHYIELLLAATAFYVLARARQVGLFKLALLTIASVVAFRTMRDSWFLCIPAAACIADSFAGDQRDPEPADGWRASLGVWAVSGLLLVLFAGGCDFTTRGLDSAMSGYFPVRAVNFLRNNPQPGPLYNTLDWGGFLMWYMPDYPVSIDGRNDLYGDDIDEQFFRTLNAAPGWENDPLLNESRLVLLQARYPLAKFLTADPRFQLIYQDNLALVFARR